MKANQPSPALLQHIAFKSINLRKIHNSPDFIRMKMRQLRKRRKANKAARRARRTK